VLSANLTPFENRCSLITVPRVTKAAHIKRLKTNENSQEHRCQCMLHPVDGAALPVIHGTSTITEITTLNDNELTRDHVLREEYTMAFAH
jgi:hypothetical protein